MKKVIFAIFLIMTVVGFSGANPLPITTPVATPVPTLDPASLTPCCDLLAFGFQPAESFVNTHSDFQLSLYTYFTRAKIAAYGFTLEYDPAMLFPGGLKGEDAVVPGDSGFMAIYNVPVSGTIKISGFDVNGIVPGNISFLKLNFSTLEVEGSTQVALKIDQLVDINSQPLLYSSNMKPARITISKFTCPYIFGDVNGDKLVNIVDTLLVAQAYVSLCPRCTVPYECAADVNADNAVTIVDALIIAQYYVGMIDELPGNYQK
ncbi:MAG: hypothetical protein JXR70_04860 [Spirochaetales bacterium]|nr:hypothetical protein [Spirochaetales bacterium]